MPKRKRRGVETKVLPMTAADRMREKFQQNGCREKTKECGQIHTWELGDKKKWVRQHP